MLFLESYSSSQLQLLLLHGSIGFQLLYRPLVQSFQQVVPLEVFLVLPFFVFSVEAPYSTMVQRIRRFQIQGQFSLLLALYSQLDLLLGYLLVYLSSYPQFYANPLGRLEGLFLPSLYRGFLLLVPLVLKPLLLVLVLKLALLEKQRRAPSLPFLQRKEFLKEGLGIFASLQ